MADDENTCSSCKHWHKLEADINHLDALRQGECREQLHLVVVPVKKGLAFRSTYAQTQEDFPACGRYALQLVALENVT